MRVRRVVIAIPVLSVVAATLVSSVCTVGPAAAVAARPSGLADSFPALGILNDVAALAPRSVWAVGRIGVCHPKSLIVRWNGARWDQMPLPAGARGGWLNGVAVTSPRNAWAAGFTGSLYSARRPLMLHWNGRVWRRVATPGAIGGVSLDGVAATSARHAWAVGYTGRNKIFILRWNGRVWRRLHTPTKGGAYLTAVAATSVRNVWAVGATGNGFGTGLIMHWNGTKWTQTAIRGLPGGGALERVAAASTGPMWAVGSTGNNTTLIMRWNGRAWRRVPSANVTGGLVGVTIVSRRDAWAVGAPSTGFVSSCAGFAVTAGISAAGVPLSANAARRGATMPLPLIFHWNGTTWQQVTSSRRSAGSLLTAASGTSAANAWAVGGLNPFQANAKVLVLRWNGKAWK